MRLPYAPLEAPDGDTVAGEIYERAKARRNPRPLLPLDLALLHAPQVADGYNAFLSAIRTKTTVPTALLELAICRIAVLNRAAFEWKGHCHLALNAGITPLLMEYIKTAPPHSWITDSSTQTDCVEGLGDKERAVLQYTDASTKNIRVSDEVFSKVKELFDDKEMVELAATVGAYNCVSRFLVALDVGEMNELDVQCWKVLT